MRNPIYVTSPSLAPLDEIKPYLDQIWSTGIMTHNGPLMQRLEQELMSYLNVPDMICVANGTCAMQIAIRALDLKGEIITTPFTFIATANIIAWERCKPIFVDIDPDNWNIDCDKIESAITQKTRAILPVHVFSRPCNVDKIKSIAENHRLKVIYDAAHAMAVDYKGNSILNCGDISCVSFHATKLFNTVEGGGCVTADPEIAGRLRRLRFFGFDENKNVVDEGMNAKMTEVNAAIGMANLRHLEKTKLNRKNKYNRYEEQLKHLTYIRFQQYDPEAYNFSYMPVLFDSEERLRKVDVQLKSHQIFARRYFYPSLHTMKIFRCQDRFPVADAISRRILCLPLYDTLADTDIDRICDLIKKTFQ
jgi:dTDP-4-amino-4,6-dideoxygalactose transaminase